MLRTYIFLFSGGGDTDKCMLQYVLHLRTIILQLYFLLKFDFLIFKCFTIQDEYGGVYICSSKLHKSWQSRSDPFFFFFFNNLRAVFVYLHHIRHSIHIDLKLPKLLMSAGEIKITEFGVSTMNYLSLCFSCAFDGRY